MRKKDKNQRTAREKIGMILDMPLDMINDCSRVTIIGNESVMIENHKGIVEYEENMIRFHNNINIFGDRLNIEEITDDDVLITGNIKNIDLEN